MLQAGKGDLTTTSRLHKARIPHVGRSHEEIYSCGLSYIVQKTKPTYLFPKTPKPPNIKTIKEDPEVSFSTVRQ